MAVRAASPPADLRAYPARRGARECQPVPSPLQGTPEDTLKTSAAPNKEKGGRRAMGSRQGCAGASSARDGWRGEEPGPTGAHRTRRQQQRRLGSSAYSGTGNLAGETRPSGGGRRGGTGVHSERRATAWTGPGGCSRSGGTGVCAARASSPPTRGGPGGGGRNGGTGVWVVQAGRPDGADRIRRLRRGTGSRCAQHGSTAQPAKIRSGGGSRSDGSAPDAVLRGEVDGACESQRERSRMSTGEAAGQRTQAGIGSGQGSGAIGADRGATGRGCSRE